MDDRWVPEPGSVVRSTSGDWTRPGIVIHVDDVERVWCWWEPGQGRWYLNGQWSRGCMGLHTCEPYEGDSDALIARFTAWSLVKDD